MTFVPVNELPESKTKRQYKRRIDILKEFLKLNVKYARADFTATEYSCAKDARSAMFQTAKTYCLPIEVKIINNELYLINRELEEKK